MKKQVIFDHLFFLFLRMILNSGNHPSNLQTCNLQLRFSHSIVNLGKKFFLGYQTP